MQFSSVKTLAIVSIFIVALFTLIGVNTMNALKISQIGIDLIKKYEGFEAKAYLCPGKKWTIGYGSTLIDGKPVVPGLEITKEKADIELHNHLDKYVCPDVNKLVTVDLNQNEFDALCSFVYNLGSGALGGSTLLKKLNAGYRSNAALEFMKWDKVVEYKSTGKVITALPGLTKRRQAEMTLFTTEIKSPSGVDKLAAKFQDGADQLLGILGFRPDSFVSRDGSHSPKA